MSPIALPVAELKTALTGLSKVLNKQSTLPVLSTIKVERTKDGWITLTVTDLDTFVTVRLEQPTEGQPKALLVPFEDLQRTVKACGKDEQIQLEDAEGDVVTVQYAIGNQMTGTRVHSYPVAEFPEIPKITADAITIPGPLRESLHQAMECASTDETRYILNGAYLDVTDPKCHHVVATDGRHLFSSNSFSLPLEKSFVVPTHRFLKWREFNLDGELHLKVSPCGDDKDRCQIQLSSRRWRFITRNIDGNYPNWRQVVPDSNAFKTKVEFDPSTLDQVLGTIQRMPCHDSLNYIIGIEVNEGVLQLLGKSQTAEQWTKIQVPNVKIEGAKILIFLNRHYLTKALKFGLTKLELIDPMSPMLFSNGGRRMIVMPTRAENPPPVTTASAVREPNGNDAVEPVNSQAGLTNPPPQPTERNPMQQNPTSSEGSNESTPTSDAKMSSLDEALDVIDTLKGSLQDGVTALKDLGGKLRQIQKEQKVTEREFQSIRSTLRSLQNVRI